MTETDDDVMLDVKAAARFIGVAVASLAKMRCLGGSPSYFKVGRKVVYRRSDLTAWLEKRRVRNTTDAANSVPCSLTDPSVTACLSKTCKTADGTAVIEDRRTRWRREFGVP
jgi:hypothetical protein